MKQKKRIIFGQTFSLGFLGVVRKHAGFSLLEVVIAMFVLSVGMLGVMTLMTTTLKSSFNQRDATIASQLAQEGVELVYNIRDTNKVSGADVFNGIGVSGLSVSYRIDANTLAKPILSSGLFSLNLLPNGTYTHAAGTATRFSRKVIVDDTSSGGAESRKVTSFVSWGGGTLPSTSSNPSGTCNFASRCAFAQVILQDY